MPWEAFIFSFMDLMAVSAKTFKGEMVLGKTKTIEDNERVGRDVEKYVAPKVSGQVIEAKNNSFDLKNHTVVYEVKSCFVNTLNQQNKKGTQSGRFVVCVPSHEKLKAEAEALGLAPLYYFVLKDRDVNREWFSIQEKIMSWAEVDELMKQGRRWIRSKDNVTFVTIQHVLIFPDGCRKGD